METRALAIVFSYAIGASLMILAGITEIIFGVKAERQSLENIAMLLTAQDSDSVRVARPRPLPDRAASEEGNDP